MKFLKGLAIGVLSFLLFVFLAVLGLSIAIRQTALNPKFVNNVVNEIDFSAVVRESLTQPANGANAPSPALVDAIVNSVNQIQPNIKQKANVLVNAGYDYILGKTPALELKGTLRNSFFNSQFLDDTLQKVDITALAEVFLKENTNANDIVTQAIVTSMITTVKQMEPTLKKDVVVISGPVFSYVLSDTNSIDLKNQLRTNVFNGEFLTYVINGFDISSLLKDTIRQQLAAALPQGIILSSSDIDQLSVVVQPLVKQRLIASADQFADYLLSIRQDFNVNVSITPLMTAGIKPIVKQAFVRQIPSSLFGASQTQIDQAFEIYWANAQGSIPTSYVINSSSLGVTGLRTSINDELLSLQQSLTEVRNGINGAQKDIEQAAQQPRDIIHVFQLAFIGLIVVTLMVIGGIILIHRSVRGASLDLGITLTCYGLLGLVGVIIIKLVVGSISFIRNLIPPGTPELAGNLIQIVIQKTSNSLLVFAIIVLVVGIALLVLSFLYKRKQDNTETNA
jgi:hypothetical protein